MAAAGASDDCWDGATANLLPRTYRERLEEGNGYIGEFRRHTSPIRFGVPM
jgi:hypothetical protein